MNEEKEECPDCYTEIGFDDDTYECTMCGEKVCVDCYTWDNHNALICKACAE